MKQSRRSRLLEKRTALEAIMKDLNSIRVEFESSVEAMTEEDADGEPGQRMSDCAEEMSDAVYALSEAVVCLKTVESCA